MAIPRAVRKQAERAEEIQKQLSGEGEPPAKPPTPEGSPPPQDDQVDWEKRFKGMKKSHDETVSELRNQNEALEAKVADLEALIEKASQDATATREVEFTPEEVEEYGEDFLKLVKRVAESTAGPRQNDDVAQELKSLKDQFKGIVEKQVKTEEERFFETLDTLVPDWEQINEMQEFKDWLADEMPMTGRERQHFLVAAQQRFDAKTVASFFDSWKGEVGMQSYYPDNYTTSEDEVSLQGGQDQTIFTGAEIEQFYDDKRRGKYKGREDEARRLEERIFLAQKQGRVSR